MAAVKVVFLKELPGLGGVGEVKAVSEGYARNYLIPQGLAMIATPAALKTWEERQRAMEKRSLAQRQQLEELAGKLQGLAFTLKAKTGGKERLYGSINAAHIAQALVEQGYPVEKRMVALPQPLRRLGSYPVLLRLAPGLEATVTVAVEAREAA